MILTLLEQITVLVHWLVPEWAVKKDSKVAHGKPWVFHEFVRLMLDKIFGAAKWAFEGGVFKTLTLANNDQLVYVVGSLIVTFADGTQATRSDVGVGLVQAVGSSPDLTTAKPEIFETGYKSAATDALKGCAADLGRCFRPLMNGNVIAAVRDGRFKALFPLGEGDTRTVDWQYGCLNSLSPAWAIQLDPLGNRYTPHEYVTECLDLIFGPQYWSFVIGSVTAETLPSGEMLVYVPGTLSVTFADGTIATRYDIGIAPIRFKKDKTDLIATPAENYETAFKAAVTDALKGCAGDLGCCFRPMLSQEMEAAVVKGYFDNEFKRLRPVDPGALDKGKRALGRDDGDLVGSSVAPSAPSLAGPVLTFGDGTAVTTDPVERAAYERYLATHDGLAPLNVNALRVFAHIYGDGKPVPDDPRAVEVFLDYVNDHAGSVPPSATNLKVWHQQHKAKTGNGQPASVGA
ncbi:MAG: hypothetical protein KA765_17325 [Thermoflexales bacterium]|nr:hypothetical protein [Thermoflexales bacterium]